MKNSNLGGTRQRRPGQRDSAASTTREEATPVLHAGLLGGGSSPAKRRSGRGGGDGVRLVVCFLRFWRAGRKGQEEGARACDCGVMGGAHMAVALSAWCLV